MTFWVVEIAGNYYLVGQNRQKTGIKTVVRSCNSPFVIAYAKYISAIILNPSARLGNQFDSYRNVETMTLREWSRL
jgi:hypothetical protein